MDTAHPVQSVVVVGGGSAGFMAALALKQKIPQLQVKVIRSKDIGVIGVGEGSGPPLTNFLHRFLGFPVDELVKATRPGFKLGTCFIWGPRERFFFPLGPHMEVQITGLSRPNGYFCHDDMDSITPMAAMLAANRAFERGPNGEPVAHQNFAYHVENDRFAAYLETKAIALGVEIWDDTVKHVECNENGVENLILASGRHASGDLYVDCSGFISLLLGKALAEPFIDFRSTLACNRAVVGGWDRAESGEPINAFTTAQTMDSGWCWQIDHPDRINRGYVYSSDFISDEEAQNEFRQKNPKVGATRMLHFISGRRERSWVKNVAAIGNASGFVEPLEATSLTVIATRCQLLAELLIDGELHVGSSHARLFNDHTARVWDAMRRFLSLHYRFNTRLDTPFWRHCREHTDFAGAEAFIEYYREVGPSVYLSQALLDPYDVWGPNGYLSILVGQRVPTRNPYRPTEQETAIVNAMRQRQRHAAQKAMSVEEVLAWFQTGKSAAATPMTSGTASARPSPAPSKNPVRRAPVPAAGSR